MDTEFPGIVATPLGTFRNKEDFHYQMLFCNVNMLKLIQVGLIYSQYQFNIRLDLFLSTKRVNFLPQAMFGSLISSSL